MVKQLPAGSFEFGSPPFLFERVKICATIVKIHAKGKESDVETTVFLDDSTGVIAASGESLSASLANHDFALGTCVDVLGKLVCSEEERRVEVASAVTALSPAAEMLHLVACARLERDHYFASTEAATMKPTPVTTAISKAKGASPNPRKTRSSGDQEAHEPKVRKVHLTSSPLKPLDGKGARGSSEPGETSLDAASVEEIESLVRNKGSKGCSEAEIMQCVKGATREAIKNLILFGLIYTNEDGNYVAL